MAIAEVLVVDDSSTQRAHLKILITKPYSANESANHLKAFSL